MGLPPPLTPPVGKVGLASLAGETVGGIAFTRGPLAHLLRNRFYIGEVVFKGDENHLRRALFEKIPC